MWVIAFMILLTLVILTLQYPYYNQTSSLVSFLSVQVVFILPLLAQVMLGNQPNNALEQAILQSDVKEYIRKFIKDHPEIIPPPKPKKNSKRGANGGSTSGGGGLTSDSGGDDNVELGEISGGAGPGDNPDGVGTEAFVNDRQKILRTNSGRASQYVTT